MTSNTISPANPRWQLTEFGNLNPLVQLVSSLTGCIVLLAASRFAQAYLFLFYGASLNLKIFLSYPSCLFLLQDSWFYCLRSVSEKLKTFSILSPELKKLFCVIGCFTAFRTSCVLISFPPCWNVHLGSNCYTTIRFLINFLPKIVYRTLSTLCQLVSRENSSWWVPACCLHVLWDRYITSTTTLGFNIKFCKMIKKYWRSLVIFGVVYGTQLTTS